MMITWLTELNIQHDELMRQLSLFPFFFQMNFMQEIHNISIMNKEHLNSASIRRDQDNKTIVNK